MKKLTKTILERTIWLGRGTATLMGLAMLLALTVGLASSALAGTGVGARFHLGQINAVDTVSTLAGSFSGPMLRIDNDLPDNPRFLNSTALDLQVEPGNPPMTVNSTDKVNNLNADQLDGRDSSSFLSVFGKANDADRLDGKDSAAFFSGKTYTKSGNNVAPNSSGVVADAAVTCDPGDPALSGGYGLISAVNLRDDFAVFAESTSGSAYSMSAKGLTPNFTFLVPKVTCADFPPLR
jgi:hypothetical protein